MYNRYDLGHNIMTIGKLGRLSVLGAPIPLVAGDRVQARLNGTWRLSPLRRNFTVDARVEVFSFYIPYRFLLPFSYNATGSSPDAARSQRGDGSPYATSRVHTSTDIPVSEWVRYLQAGVDGSGRWMTNNQSGSNPLYNRNDTETQALKRQYALGYFKEGTSGGIPSVFERGYLMIYNHYFREPTNQAPIGSLTLSSDSVDDDSLRWGLRCSNLKDMWTTPVSSDIDSDDYEVAVASNALDLRELAQQKAKLMTELERSYDSQRYRDIIKSEYHGMADADVDFRPQIVAHSKFNMSGFEVNGTETDNLGQSVGKSVGSGGFAYPMRYFPEHGLLFNLALLRFPPIFKNQGHRLYADNFPDYTDITGDPSLVASTTPETLQLRELFYTGSTATAGKYPKCEHYRSHPHQVHPDLYQGDDFGFPIMDTPADAAGMWRCPVEAWDRAFSSMALQHWQFFGYMDVEKLSVVPPAGSSIFTGSK